MNKSDFDEVFDFVVVGSGGGSMCAALVARTAGKSVVILEKAELVGGTTAMSGGVMWIPNNRFMQDAGAADSSESAMAYLEATAGQSVDAPGTSRERRAAYVNEAPKMVDFLVSQGIKLRRVDSWPDYYDERPGGSVPGRTVIAEIFDVNELGDWKLKLRSGFMAVPAYHSEAFEISTMRSSWHGKLALIKVVCRMGFSKLRGQQLVSFGRALQARMLQKALQLSPGETQAESLLGWAQMLHEDYDDALGTFQKVLMKEPANSLARINVGYICLKKRIFGEAIEHLSKAIRLDNDKKATLYAHFYLGLVYLQREMYEDAQTFFQKTLKLGPNLIEAYYELGRAYWFAGDQDQAKRAWDDGFKANKFNPWGKKCQDTLALALQGQEPPRT